MAKNKKKAKKKAIRTYQAAVRNNLTSDWQATGSSQDAETWTALKPTRNRIRDLQRNFSYVKGAINTLAVNIVGDSGIRLQSQVRQKSTDKLDKKLNKQIEDLWVSCTENPKYWDTAGQLNLWDMLHLAIKNLPQSGEVFFRIVEQSFDGSPVPFALEMIESDQLADDYNVKTYGDNTIRMGVEYNQWRRPVAYWFYLEHPGDTFFPTMQSRFKVERVPADQIVHLYLSERPGQTRGMPWFHSLVIDARNTSGYITGEVVASRAQANVMGALQVNDPESLMEAAEVEQNAPPTLQMAPNTILPLAPGETMNWFNPSRPAGNFGPFIDAVNRSMAAGAGMSYESWSKDYSKSNFSSTRQSLINERDYYRVIQQWLIVHLVNVIYPRWLDLAVLSGALNIPSYWVSPRFYCKPKWICRGWDWVDPLKDVNAKIAEVKAGFNSITNIAAEQGFDMEEIFGEIAEEQKLAESLGLNLNTVPQSPDQLSQSERKVLAELERRLAAKNEPKIIIAKR